MKKTQVEAFSPAWWCQIYLIYFLLYLDLLVYHEAFKLTCRQGSKYPFFLLQVLWIGNLKSAEIWEARLQHTMWTRMQPDNYLSCLFCCWWNTQNRSCEILLWDRKWLKLTYKDCNWILRKCVTKVIFFFC